MFDRQEIKNSQMLKNVWKNFSLAILIYDFGKSMDIDRLCFNTSMTGYQKHRTELYIQFSYSTDRYADRVKYSLWQMAAYLQKSHIAL